MSSSFHFEILPLIEQYLHATATAPSTLGQKALNDPGFVYRLRNGCQPRLDTIEQVLDYINDHLDELRTIYERPYSEADLRADLHTIVEEAASVSVDLINQTMLIPIPDDLFARLHVVEGRA